MSRGWAKAHFAELVLDRDSDVPIRHQIADFLRRDISGGRLPPGTRLQSARSLGRQLGCSRGTVAEAMEMLEAEGLVELRVGGVARVAVGAARQGTVQPDLRIVRSSLADRLLAVDDLGGETFGAMSPALPDVTGFPFPIWAGLFRKVWTSPRPELLTSRDPMGYLPLREAIASHLAALRGFRVTADQIVVFPGTRHALQTVARLLAEPGDSAWCEDPTFLSCRMALTAAGLQLVPIPVDAEGLDVASGLRRCPEAKLAVVAASNQFPLGGPMSLERRQQLMAWSRGTGAWVFEDDYDSEFLFPRQVLPPLALLPGGERVVYFGTFSKIIFPNLRLSYAVAHPQLAQEIGRFRLRIDSFTAFPMQPVLARFISEGHLAAHVRELARDQTAKLSLLESWSQGPMHGLFDPVTPRAGLHVVLRFSDALAARTTDVALAADLAGIGLQVRPLSQYHLEAEARQGLVIGYLFVNLRRLEDALNQIREVALRACAGAPPA